MPALTGNQIFLFPQGAVHQQDQSIGELYREGEISLETALHHADKPDQLKRLIG